MNNKIQQAVSNEINRLRPYLINAIPRKPTKHSLLFFFFYCLLSWLAFLLIYIVPANAVTAIDGPVKADVVSVYDGDTIKILTNPWPDIFIKVSVRVLGVDTPELRGNCASEKIRAKEAKEFVVSKIHQHVYLYNIRPGKYVGRVLADVVLEDGENIAQLLIENGYARKYNGGKRKGWCE